MGNIFGFKKNSKVNNQKESDDIYFNEYKKLIDEKNKELIRSLKLYKWGDSRYDPCKYNDVFYGATEQMNIINDLKNGDDSNVLFADSGIMKRRRLLRKAKRNSTIDNPVFDLVSELKKMDNKKKWDEYKIRRLNDEKWLYSNSFFQYDSLNIKLFLAKYNKKVIEGQINRRKRYSTIG